MHAISIVVQMKFKDCQWQYCNQSQKQSQLTINKRVSSWCLDASRLCQYIYSIFTRAKSHISQLLKLEYLHHLPIKHLKVVIVMCSRWTPNVGGFIIERSFEVRASMYGSSRSIFNLLCPLKHLLRIETFPITCEPSNSQMYIFWRKTMITWRWRKRYKQTISHIDTKVALSKSFQFLRRMGLFTRSV